jgi:hypothetical protein
MRFLGTLLGFLALPAAVIEAAADFCPQPGSEIATDRPDTTNSSLAVPQGSLQQENGVNISGRDGGQVLDGTNTRLSLPGCGQLSAAAAANARRAGPTGREAPPDQAAFAKIRSSKANAAAPSRTRRLSASVRA